MLLTKKVGAVSYCVIHKRAMSNSEYADLYGNSGKRFKKINNHWNFQYNAVNLIDLVCSCLLCVF